MIKLAKELLAGRELFDIIVDDNMFDDLTEDILKGMIRQVTLGLEHIHSKNIVHLDLKPENLIANRNPNGDFNCKIVDFGIAEHVTDELGFIPSYKQLNFTKTITLFHMTRTLTAKIWERPYTF